MENAIHFVNFRDAQQAANAVRVFGWPDFWHRNWDVRARAEIMPGDTAVFASGSIADEPKEQAWDDSEAVNQGQFPFGKRLKFRPPFMGILRE